MAGRIIRVEVDIAPLLRAPEVREVLHGKAQDVAEAYTTATGLRTVVEHKPTAKRERYEVTVADRRAAAVEAETGALRRALDAAGG